MYEVKDERHAEAFLNRESFANEESLPLGERVAALRDDRRVSAIPNDVKLGPGGSREISFRARSNSKYKEDEDDEHRGKRRGVQSLGLKPNGPGFGGRGGRGGRGRGGRGGHRGRGRGGR